VIDAFLDSWPLFQTTYLAGWTIAFALALVGVWVVARDQIFLGVAVAQASTLGVAGALWIGGLGVGAVALGEDGIAAALAVTASVATALVTVLRREGGSESAEALTGWVFLVSASVPTLMLAHDPHGLEEVHQLLFSTLLGATQVDLTAIAAMAAVMAVLTLRFHEPLRLLAIDPDQADAVGLSGRAWHAGLAICLGLAVGLSIRVSGTLYTFGCLVLPALVAKHLVRDVRALMIVAPIVALIAAGIGFVLANHFDTPPAHATVALLCGFLALAWMLPHRGRPRGINPGSPAP
jgi:ABC-type Mn2+/Zn2+ transport system permease subunit